MKITLLTYGSRGDVEPFAALSRGLAEAGHSVRLAAPQAYASLVDQAAVDFLGFPGDPRQLVQQLSEGSGDSPWGSFRAISRFAIPLAVQISQLAREACRGTDLVIHSFLLTMTGHALAREQGLPDISAQLFPVFASTGEFPAPTFPDLPLGGAYRRLTHAFTAQFFRHGSRLLYSWVRRKHPDLPPLAGWPFSPGNPRPTPLLYAFSPQVVPQPEDWDKEALVTGYWFLQDRGDWAPDPDLLSFLEEGPPPVAVAFGSTASREMGRVYQKTLAALMGSGQRGILVGGGPTIQALPPAVHQAPALPYGWLFPRCAAVIHHGGAGTTGRALQAGVPSVILPFTSDQPFWGRRVFKLGAGPAPIPAKRLSVNGLAQAIDRAVQDSRIRARAQALGQRIRQEDGVGRAVQFIENWVSSSVDQ